MTKISKKIFEFYKKRLSIVWSQIGIIKTDDGYKITYVKRPSIFSAIGLKKGDIILEINGKKLNSDADAWNLYKNIDKFNDIELKIKRNYQTKVLHYEIY